MIELARASSQAGKHKSRVYVITYDLHDAADGDHADFDKMLEDNWDYVCKANQTTRIICTIGEDEKTVLEVIKSELRRLKVKSLKRFTITALSGNPIADIDDPEQRKNWGRIINLYQER